MSHLCIDWSRYVLISLHGMPNWMIRGGIFSWIPFVMRDLGLSEAQRALLMGAWFPGCKATPACLPHPRRCAEADSQACVAIVVQMRLRRFQPPHSW